MRGRRFRPFRFGLVLGVVGALVWFLQRQRAAELPAPAPAGARPAPAPAPAPTPAPAPVLPIVEPDVLEVGDLDRPGEPEVETVEPAPQTAEAPVAKKVPPTKKAAPRKPAAKKAAAKRAAPLQKPTAPAVTWVAPEGGLCPTTHPVKAKLSSKLFHLPGMFAYARTNPDRCYADAASAEADGLRPAKR